MSALAERHVVLTPAEFGALPDAVGFELIDGELKERCASRKSSHVALRLGGLLDAYTRREQLGTVYGTDLGLQISPGRLTRIRKADVVFVSRERLDEETEPDTGFLRIAPDLAVEVVSPNDLAEELDEKVQEHLGAGVRLVWVVYPATQRVTIFRSDGTAAVAGADGELSGEETVPGFSCRVAELFATK